MFTRTGVVSAVCCAFLISCTSDSSSGETGDTSESDTGSDPTDEGTDPTTNGSENAEAEGDGTDSNEGAEGNGEESDPNDESMGQDTQEPDTGNDDNAEETDTTETEPETSGGDESGTGDESGESGGTETAGEEPVDECIENGFDITISRDVEEDGSNVELDGWEIGESMGGEGWFVRPEEEAADGASATFTVNLPCEGAWRIWVKSYNEGGSEDSFLVQIDDEPESPITFDSDCDAGWNGYFWRRMEARPDEGSHCDGEREEWPQWLEAGEHKIKFMDGGGDSVIAEIKVTNDMDYEP